MCAASAIGNNYRELWPERWPAIPPFEYTPDNFKNYVTQIEFLALKREVEELRKLLEAANKFDKATGQKECVVEDKVAFIKQVAKLVGVDLKNVLD